MGDLHNVITDWTGATVSGIFKQPHIGVTSYRYSIVFSQPESDQLHVIFFFKQQTYRHNLHSFLIQSIDMNLIIAILSTRRLT